MKYLKVLYVQVQIGIVLGILCGWRFPSFAPVALRISETFINMILMIIAPVIFCSIVTGIAGAGNMKKVGRLGVKSLIYFEVVSSLALVIGLLVANLLKPGEGVAHGTAPRGTGDQKLPTRPNPLTGEISLTHIVPPNICETRLCKGRYPANFIF